MLTDPSKRSYVNNKLDEDRRKKEKYAAMEKKKRGLVDVSRVSFLSSPAETDINTLGSTRKRRGSEKGKSKCLPAVCARDGRGSDQGSWTQDAGSHAKGTPSVPDSKRNAAEGSRPIGTDGETTDDARRSHIDTPISSRARSRDRPYARLFDHSRTTHYIALRPRQLCYPQRHQQWQRTRDGKEEEEAGRQSDRRVQGE